MSARKSKGYVKLYPVRKTRKLGGDVLIEDEENGLAIDIKKNPLEEVYHIEGYDGDLVLVPASGQNGWIPNSYACCFGWFGSGCMQMATLIGVYLILVLMIIGVAVCWGYVYPNTVHMVDSKLDGAVTLLLNLAIENIAPIANFSSCIVDAVETTVNDALGPALGLTFDLSFGNGTIFDMCPLTFAGLDHTISQSAVSEALGPTSSSTAPSFSEQLSDLEELSTHSSSPPSSRSSSPSRLR